MGHLNIRLDDVHTNKFKDLKKELGGDNDEVVQKLIVIAQDYLDEKTFKNKKNNEKGD